jgi:cysteine desulfuration protein SufE
MPPAALDRAIQRFGTADQATRLELLLDYSRRLPDLPERFHASRDKGMFAVPECQSPVFLLLEREPDGSVVLQADAPREAPTVRGFVSFLARTLKGASPAEAQSIPSDLLDRLGLSGALGMTRTHGLSSIVARVKRMAAELAATPTTG